METLLTMWVPSGHINLPHTQENSLARKSFMWLHLELHFLRAFTSQEIHSLGHSIPIHHLSTFSRVRSPSSAYSLPQMQTHKIRLPSVPGSCPSACLSSHHSHLYSHNTWRLLEKPNTSRQGHTNGTLCLWAAFNATSPPSYLLPLPAPSAARLPLPNLGLAPHSDYSTSCFLEKGEDTTHHLLIPICHHVTSCPGLPTVSMPWMKHTDQSMDWGAGKADTYLGCKI